LSLLQSAEILARFPLDDEHVPFILHGMPEPYYRLLLNLNTAGALAQFQDIVDRAGEPKAIVHDDGFIALLNAGDGAELKSDDEPEFADALIVDPALLVLPPLDPNDVITMQKNAVAAMLGHTAAAVDIAETRYGEVDGHRVSVHFDNCSHQSGKPRIYCACPLKKVMRLASSIGLSNIFPRRIMLSHGWFVGTITRDRTQT
jgi:hypothetical protein